MFGLESWKPVIGALLITPVPMLLLLFVGARTMTRHRGAGFFVVLLSSVLLYLSACSGTSRLMQDLVLRPPRALGLDAIERLRAQSKTAKANDPLPAVIVVLGGGRERFAPEYGMSTLTATSMGRLMLNVLLSFAQFEREVTGERIRDKFAASKRKGMWMGGQVPMGYCVDNRKLVVVPEEAEVVRQIFDSFVATRSTTLMVKQLVEQGVTSKNGKPLSKQALYTILHNRLYMGDIGHKGDFYPGQHEALIDQSQ